MENLIEEFENTNCRNVAILKLLINSSMISGVNLVTGR